MCIICTRSCSEILYRCPEKITYQSLSVLRNQNQKDVAISLIIIELHAHKLWGKMHKKVIFSLYFKVLPLSYNATKTAKDLLIDLSISV